MSPITTHVLDTARGRPAGGIIVELHRCDSLGAAHQEIGQGVTNADGRVADLLAEGEPEPGVYRLVFHTADYYAVMGERSFYPRVEICFEVAPRGGHYHVPLLLSPFGYSTYRGS
ncbi:5-hydroxyisourate hydrolase precursor [Pseudobythopirellula maris]|uniref:5-hydroxyisourate hydrolase n=1 Tax=Pseudobythopirellula maris TaxID=2527991 RepID=A0A5C5ZKG9_9BACT|nr:hydroxyisourate hydrolase [Pseudobythopirellula maris]TWT87635.1 5-hydroxyisourate hydrolase precursor [Pseudobythopirellula maris]